MAADGMDGAGFGHGRPVAMTALLAWVPPLTPDAGQAQRWAQQELRDPAYAAAQPTPLDRLARAVQEFVERLFAAHASDTWAAWLAGAVALALAAVIIVAVISSARRGRTRRPPALPAVLFGDAESRTAAQLRRAADAAAAAENWAEAVVLRFRALARGLVERGVVELPPGATAHAFAREAGAALPGLGAHLDAAADAFDDVRYLRRPGTAAMHGTVADADAAASAARPDVQPGGWPGRAQAEATR